jgi:hypothetical protein
VASPPITTSAAPGAAASSIARNSASGRGTAGIAARSSRPARRARAGGPGRPEDTGRPRTEGPGADGPGRGGTTRALGAGTVVGSIPLDGLDLEARLDQFPETTHVSAGQRCSVFRICPHFLMILT